MPKTVIIIPCHREEARLDIGAVVSLASDHGISVLLVDDGSPDGTLGVLRRIEAAAPSRVGVLVLPENRGKAEAVRQGMRAALEQGADLVGFADADLATPVPEVVRLVRTLEEDTARTVVMGSRIARAGARIDRRFLRHYTGRVFATLASLILRHSFYDTQCGAKVFRACPALHDALATPFSSRWSFDVEIIGRLLTALEPVPFEAFLELPLSEWHEVSGSKLDLWAQVRATLELCLIARALRSRRACLGRRFEVVEHEVPVSKDGL